MKVEGVSSRALGGIFYSLTVLLAWSCTTDLTVPLGVEIACSSKAQCPDDWECNAAMGTCSPPGDNRAPKATVSVDSLIQGRRHVAWVPLSIAVLDPNLNDTVSVDVAFSLDDPQDPAATWFSVDLGGQSLEAIPQGQNRSVVWHALAQAEAHIGGLMAASAFAEDGTEVRWVSYQPRVTLRLLPTDNHGLTGDPMYSQSFPLGNDPPSLDLPSTLDDTLAGDVSVIFGMADTAGDIGAVELQFRLSGEPAWRAGALLAGSGDGLFAPPQGATRSIIWQSLEPPHADTTVPQGVGAQNVEALALRLRASDEHGVDGRGYGPWVETTLSKLNNRSAPRVTHLEVRRLELAGGHGPLHIRYRLVEQEGAPVDVVFEYNSGLNLARLRTREYPSIWSEGTQQLATLPESQGGFEHQFIWDVSGTTQTGAMLWARAAGIGGESITGFDLARSIAFEPPALEARAIPDDETFPWPVPPEDFPSGLLIVPTASRDAVRFRRVPLGGVLSINSGWHHLAYGAGDWTHGPTLGGMARVAVADGDMRLACHSEDNGACETFPEENVTLRIYSTSETWPGAWRIAVPYFMVATSEDLVRRLPSIAVGDFRGDGTLMAAVGVAVSTEAQDLYESKLYDLPQPADVLLDPAAPVGGGFHGWPLAVADIDGDGRDDLLTYATNTTGSSLGGVTRVYLSQGNHTFDLLLEVVESVAPRFGWPTGNTHPGLQLWLGTLDGQIQQYIYDAAANHMELVRTYPSGVSPSSMDFGDVTGDDLADLVIASQVPAGLTIFPGAVDRAGRSTLGAPLFYPLHFSTPRPQVRLADLDGAKPLEIVSSSHEVRVFHLTGSGMRTGSFGSPFRISNASEASAQVGDVDFDGIMDLVLRSSDGQMRVQPMLRALSNAEPTDWLLGAGFPALLLDVDNSGLLHVIGGTGPSFVPTLWLNQTLEGTTANFSPVSIDAGEPFGLPYSTATAGDLTGNGVLDFIVPGGELGNDPHALLAPHASDLTAAWSFEALPAAPEERGFSGHWLLEDITGDGRLDLLTTVWAMGDITTDRYGLALFPGCDDGCIFDAGQLIADIARPHPYAPDAGPIAVHDLDQDGWPDVFFGIRHDLSHKLAYILNQGAGNFDIDVCWVELSDWGAGLAHHVAPRTIHLSDYNADGVTDALLWLHDGTGPQILFGTIDPAAENDCVWQVENTMNISMGLGVSDVAVADINGDGVADLVANNGWAVLGTVRSDALKPWVVNLADAAAGTPPALLRNGDQWAHPDAFGFIHRPTMVLHPAFSPTMRLHVSAQARWRAALPLGGSLRALTAEWYAEGDVVWRRVFHEGESRWQHQQRLGAVGADGVPQPFTLEAASFADQHGILLELPWLDGVALEGGETVRVVRRSRDHWRANEVALDPLYGHPEGAAFLPRIPQEGGGHRDVVRERIEWTELAHAPDNQLSQGTGARFVVHHERRRIHVVTDKLGWFQAYIE